MTITDWIQAISMVILVAVTVIYAWRTHVISKATKQQADASVKMAEEMREQRKPIIVQEVVPPQYLGLSVAREERDNSVTCDGFKIHNLGNSPAIELEVILLNQRNGLLGSEKRTFLAPTDKPVGFYPLGLEGQLNSTCSLLCRYRSSDEGKMWYLTKLPFVPKKSQRGDHIIIEPKELEFSSAFEKESY